ncbi:DUF732 domain-containing protein [Mycobacterium mantenii]|uniref:DUF732 domain-containing protein n=1 Tax=Mycobacterium mantenii TaxID=560555 RepID=UPI0013CFC6A4
MTLNCLKKDQNHAKRHHPRRSRGVGPAHCHRGAGRADGASYIQYLNDHNIFVPGINDAVRISRGSQVCVSLHNGMTPQQIIDANPIVYFDLRGVIDAAQHELCPDTLH